MNRLGQAAMGLLSVTATPAFAAALPAQFLGRWEQEAKDCQVLLEERDSDGWIVVKPTRLEFFEGVTDRILTSSRLGKNRYDLSVLVVEPTEGRHRERYTIYLNDDQDLSFRFQGGEKLTFHRCVTK